MILTCPKCATRYLAGEAEIPACGRRVRCDACAAEWVAEASREPLPVPFEPPPSPAADTLFARPDPVRRPARGGAWLGLAAAAVVILGAALAFRAEIVRALPGTAGAFAAVGLPVTDR
jgi:predicted Zn finger-like uncharacterized protein